jgi:hypothetical protein
MPITIQNFASIQALTAFAEKTVKANLGGFGSAGLTHSPSRAWDYNTGWHGTLKLAREGWSDGAARVAKLADKLADKVTGEQANSRLEYRDDGGPIVDISRYLEGEPEHFMEFAPEPARKPVTLVINLCCSGMIEAEHLERRGAVVLAAAQILAARGYVVEIKAAVSSGEPGDYCQTLCQIHAPGTALDADAIAFALAHPAFYRRLVFSCEEASSVAHRRKYFSPGKGYGRVMDPPVNERPAGIYEKSMMSAGSYSDDEGAARRVLEICKEAGCEIRD